MKISLSVRSAIQPYVYRSVEWPWDSPPRVGDHVQWFSVHCLKVWRVDWHVSEGNARCIIHATECEPVPVTDKPIIGPQRTADTAPKETPTP